MKLEIYDRSKSKPPVMSPVILRLQYCTLGVEVVAVDTDGKTIDAGHILRINNDGTVFRHLGVYGGFGFDLNSSGQIRTQ